MSATTPRPRWFRYSLGSLFVVVTLVAIWLGWELKFIHERQSARAWLGKGNGWAETWDDYKNTPSQSARDPADRNQPSMQIPFWRVWLGDEAMAHIGFEQPATAADRERIGRLFPEAEISSQ